MDILRAILIVFVALVGFVLLITNLRQATIFEYERGLFYRGGKFQRILDPGQHWYFPRVHLIHTIRSHLLFWYNPSGRRGVAQPG